MKRKAVFIFMAMILFTSPAAGKPLTVGFLVGAGGLGDESYNDMTLAGVSEAKKKYGFDFVHETCDETPDGVRSALGELFRKNVRVMVMNRIAQPEIIYEYAEKHTGCFFIVNDMPWAGHGNMVCLGYAHHEGAFLAGALAGWMSRTRKVAFIGGNDLPVIRNFRIAFAEGVRFADKEIILFEEMVAPGKDTGGFNNPKRAFELAENLYNIGVDIIFAAAGLSGNGVIHAAKKNNRFSIGVDTDQDHMAKGNVLTSVVKGLDKATYDEISAVMEGRFAPGVKYYGLKEGGIRLSGMRFTRQIIGETILARIRETEEKVKTGKIKITAFDYLEAQKLPENLEIQ